jgi:3-methyl-2-oxobutanoate hydroxymethyltransferase
VRRKVTTVEIVAKKRRREKIVQITAYDFPFARLADEAGADIIMVGDSLAQVALGFDQTIYVDMEVMLHHTRAVARAKPRALLLADLPFMSYQLSAEQAVRNAGRLVQEGGAEGVKLEGGVAVRKQIEAIVNAGIPVMGHVGQTPQSVHRFGCYDVRGIDEVEAERILEDARAIEEAGAFALTLEMMPSLLGRRIAEAVGIPAIGNGAGPHCDGQVMILNDVLGFNLGPLHPSYIKEYLPMAQLARDALARYCEEVRKGMYPGPEHGY